MEQADHEEIARSLREHPAKKGVAFNIAVTLLEIGGGIALFTSPRASAQVTSRRT